MPTWKYLNRAALMLALIWGFGALAQAAVPPDRMQVLSRGVNLSTVFSDHPEPVYRLLSDLGVIKSAGLHNVRIIVNVSWANQLDTKQNRLDRIVHAAVRQHLGVILCMISGKHPMDDTATPQTVEMWRSAWTKLAKRYADLNPNLIFFELANEPGMKGERWDKIQNDLLRTVRAIAPRNTILLTASPVSMVWSLPTLTPSTDPDVGYTVHLYQPMWFTHQGATWAGPPYMYIHGLEYPPNAANVHDVEQRARPEVASALKEYLQSGASAIKRELTVAQRWATAHSASIVVTEFGVYDEAPAASRVRWLAAAREGIEARDFGWDVWEYQGGFGVKPSLVLTGCNSTKRALGLCK